MIAALPAICFSFLIKAEYPKPDVRSEASLKNTLPIKSQT